jgi:ribonuclease D
MVFDEQPPLIDALRRSPWIALDTEADSLHSYPEKLCLLQLSHAGGDALVDPLRSEALTPLLDVLSTRELTLHGADFDLRLLPPKATSRAGP